MTARVERVFEELAVQLDVAESDYLLLKRAGMMTCSSYFFKIPKQEDLEEFLQSQVAPFSAFDQNGTIVVFQRTPPVAWPDFKRSDDACALRQLWQASKTLASKELDDRVSGQTGDAGAAPKRMSAAVHADLVRKAQQKGSLPLLRPSNTPGKSCLALVQANHGVGGKMSHIAWEEFITIEEEQRQERMGIRKEGADIFSLSQGDLMLKRRDAEYEKMRVHDTLALQDVLTVRTHAYEILGLVPVAVYSRYSDELVLIFKRQPAESMRGPTVGELKMMDRLIHDEVLTQVIAGSISLGDGLKWFVEQGRNHALWALGDQVIEATPDRGIERKLKVDPGSGPKASSGSQGLPVQAAVDKGTKEDLAERATCNLCGKYRHEHEKRRFCQPDKEMKKAIKAEKGKGKGKGKVKGSSWSPHGVKKEEKKAS
jgi:hypothetical protein